jgi:hypothetical protein
MTIVIFRSILHGDSKLMMQKKIELLDTCGSILGIKNNQNQEISKTI